MLDKRNIFLLFSLTNYTEKKEILPFCAAIRELTHTDYL